LGKLQLKIVGYLPWCVNAFQSGFSFFGPFLELYENSCKDHRISEDVQDDSIKEIGATIALELAAKCMGLMQFCVSTDSNA
jgi:hypothetical protein